jgi:simple sugar transport system ATP-binding protein
VLLTAYAVRGLDINASYTIYDLVNRQKDRGVAVIFVGEDLDVLLELSDRILVLCGGKVSGIVDGRKTDKNEVGLLMTKLGGEKVG